MQIAVVEDNVSMAKGISYVLRDAGHAVDILHDGVHADAFLRSDNSELIILDINLPGMSGIEILKALRARDDHRPVILLTARSETTDRVAGLDAGADDYLVKPFEMEELQARIRALSRRRSQDVVSLVRIGALVLDITARKILADDEELLLPRREFSLFDILLKAKGRCVTKASILDQLYGTGADVDEKVVEVYISRLRKRLTPFGVGIKVRRGIGYEIIELN